MFWDDLDPTIYFTIVFRFLCATITVWSDALVYQHICSLPNSHFTAACHSAIRFVSVNGWFDFLGLSHRFNIETGFTVGV